MEHLLHLLLGCTLLLASTGGPLEPVSDPAQDIAVRLCPVEQPLASIGKGLRHIGKGLTGDIFPVRTIIPHDYHIVVAQLPLLPLGDGSDLRQVIQEIVVVAVVHVVGVVLVGQCRELCAGRGFALFTSRIKPVLLGLAAVPALLVGLHQLFDELLPGEGFQLLLHSAAGPME